MNFIKSSVMVLALLAPALEAQAHGYWYGGWRGGWGYRGGYYGGITIGPGWGWPYYEPYYAFPPAIVTVPVPTSPPVYIEQGVQQPPQDSANYWHYCDDPPGYYPTVRECPAGWQLVPPQPPASQQQE